MMAWGDPDLASMAAHESKLPPVVWFAAGMVVGMILLGGAVVCWLG